MPGDKESGLPADQPKEAGVSETNQSRQPAAGLAPVPQRQPLSSEEERTWAMLAHLSILANLITGLLGIAFALIVYLAYKDRSRYVADQAMQAFVFQMVAWFGGGIVVAIAWIIIVLLMFVLVGFCLIPLGIVISAIPLAAVCYGVVAAYQCNQGQDFRYWMVGEWVHGDRSNP